MTSPINGLDEEVPKEHGDDWERQDGFGVCLRALREDRELTQGVLAQRMGRSVSYVSLIESGQRRPTEKLLLIIKEALVLSEEEEEKLFEAAGLPKDALNQAVRGFITLIASQVPMDEIDAELLRADLTAFGTAWRRFLQGKQKMQTGDFGMARQYFEEVVSRPELSPTLRAYSASNLADFWEKSGDLPRAEQQLADAQQNLEPLPFDWAISLRAEIDALQGIIDTRTGLYQKALTAMMRAQAQHLKLLDDGPEARAAAALGLTKAYNRLAVIHLLQAEPEIALAHCETAETYLKRVSESSNDRRRLRLASLKAWAYTQMGKFDEAKNIYTEARQVYERLHDTYGVAKNWLYLGDAYREQITVFTHEGEDPGYLKAALTGDVPPNVFANQPDLPDWLVEAEHCYREAIGGLESLKENILLSRAYRSLGEILRLKGMVGLTPKNKVYNESLPWLTRAFEIESRIGQGRRLPNTFESLGRLELEFGTLAAARDNYQLALDALNDRRRVNSADPAAKGQRTRCEHALQLIHAKLMEVQVTGARTPVFSGPRRNIVDGDSPFSQEWRVVSERLIETVAAVVRDGKREPVATSDAEQNWRSLIKVLEQEPGSRYLAQNRLSNALSSTPPPGYPPQAAREHQERHNQFILRTIEGADKNHDLCWSNAVEEALEDPTTQQLCWNQVGGAIRVLNSAPEHYELFASKHNLPLGFYLKGDRSLVEVPGALAPHFKFAGSENMSERAVLCYCIDDEPKLAEALRKIFGDFAALCERGTGAGANTLAWLEAISDRWLISKRLTGANVGAL